MGKSHVSDSIAKTAVQLLHPGNVGWILLVLLAIQQFPFRVNPTNFQQASVSAFNHKTTLLQLVNDPDMIEVARYSEAGNIVSEVFSSVFARCEHILQEFFVRTLSVASVERCQTLFFSLFDRLHGGGSHRTRVWLFRHKTELKRNGNTS